jgi:hypothetical protein
MATTLQLECYAYGAAHFAFEMLAELRERPDEFVDYATELKAFEKLYLTELQPFGERGYNIPKL